MGFRLENLFIVLFWLLKVILKVESLIPRSRYDFHWGIVLWCSFDDGMSFSRSKDQLEGSNLLKYYF